MRKDKLAVLVGDILDTELLRSVVVRRCAVW